MRTETEVIHFKDSEGRENGATFTIRKRLSHDALNAWVIAIQRLGQDGDGRPDLEGLQESRRTLVRGGLLAIEGVEDESGAPYTPDRAFEMDAALTTQIYEALQRRNAGEPDPNSVAPSGESAGRASSRTKTSRPSTS